MSSRYFLIGIVAIFCTLSAFGVPSTKIIPTAHAQQLVSPTNALQISVAPQSPGPFESVTIIVEDFSRDLNKVTISWSVNGKMIQSGVGMKRFQLTAGALGTVTTVSINMGGDIHDIVIRPAVTDLLWQADTYTPPFFMGKALHTNEDPVTVVAEPFFIDNKGARLDPSKLIYKWSKNGKISDGSSGYGKKTFRIIPSILLKPIQVSVNVSSTDGTYTSSAEIEIPNSQPEVGLYENHPLYGIMFGKQLNEKDFPITDSEVRIIGIPFFFSNQEKTGNKLVFNWRLNNTAVDQQGSEVVFRKPNGNAEGQSQVSLDVSNLVKTAQTASARLLVRYNVKTSAPTTQTIF